MSIARIRLKSWRTCCIVTFQENVYWIGWRSLVLPESKGGVWVLETYERLGFESFESGIRRASNILENSSKSSFTWPVRWSQDQIYMNRLAYFLRKSCSTTVKLTQSILVYTVVQMYQPNRAAHMLTSLEYMFFEYDETVSAKKPNFLANTCSLIFIWRLFRDSGMKPRTTAPESRQSSDQCTWWFQIYGALSFFFVLYSKTQTSVFQSPEHRFQDSVLISNIIFDRVSCRKIQIFNLGAGPATKAFSLLAALLSAQSSFNFITVSSDSPLFQRSLSGTSAYSTSTSVPDIYKSSKAIYICSVHLLVNFSDFCAALR